MTGNRKQLLTVTLTILTVLCIGISSGLAYVCDNGAGTGYEEGDPPSGTSAYLSSLTIESYIEAGAGYFLKAKEETDALLKMVELQNAEGVNLVEMRNTVESALISMHLAQESYNALVAKAESTPYNNTVIDTLNQFNYIGFGQDNQLNGFVLSQVEGYLKNGDITGIFKRKIPIFTGIVSSLETAKADLEKNVVPDVSGLWKLNETFSEMSLFGSYVARVFHEIN